MECPESSILLIFCHNTTVASANLIKFSRIGHVASRGQPIFEPIIDALSFFVRMEFAVMMSCRLACAPSKPFALVKAEEESFESVPSLYWVKPGRFPDLAGTSGKSKLEANPYRL